MPGIEACEGTVAALRRQFERVGELLREVDDGRWWPNDRVGSEEVTKIAYYAQQIEENVWMIAQIVAKLKI